MNKGIHLQQLTESKYTRNYRKCLNFDGKDFKNMEQEATCNIMNLVKQQTNLFSVPVTTRHSQQSAAHDHCVPNNTCQVWP
jgi:hypothetical protein